ncbi:hypothetical protein WMF26_25540 [Sorangium sp. So ce185]|uniref:hypothetical protein n=1 Tax=Sorangium sp. So ce185 TaxID=3133287 RepID=UPI003F615A50
MTSSRTRKALKDLDGDVARVEPILEQGAKFDEPNIAVRDGDPFNWKTGETLTPIDSSSSLFPLPSSLFVRVRG